jgi:hypothetical protein
VLRSPFLFLDKVLHFFFLWLFMGDDLHINKKNKYK